jgi:hypothetical protein
VGRPRVVEFEWVRIAREGAGVNWNDCRKTLCSDLLAAWGLCAVRLRRVARRRVARIGQRRLAGQLVPGGVLLPLEDLSEPGQGFIDLVLTPTGGPTRIAMRS